MKQKKPILWWISLLVLLLVIPFIVPSAVMDADAEGEAVLEDLEEVPEVPAADPNRPEMTYDGWTIGWTLADLPAYEPVTLENPSPDALPLGGPKEKSSTPVPYAPHEDSFLPDQAGYLDSTLSVRIETRVIMNTKVFFTFVQIADPSQLRTEVFSGNGTAVHNKTGKFKSVLAINGDWYYADEKGGLGYIFRNGHNLRKMRFGEFDGLFIDVNGDFHILRHAKKEDVEAAPFFGSILHSFVFGPALVIDGEIVTLNYASMPKAGNMPSRDTADGILSRKTGAYHQTQRTVLCQMGPLSYLIITAEGPEQSDGGGFPTSIMAQLAKDMGALQAFNLDGGSSAQLVLGNDRLNALGNGGKSKRAIGDMIYFATAEP